MHDLGLPLPKSLNNVDAAAIKELSEKALPKFSAFLEGVDSRGHAGLEAELNHLAKPEIFLANFSVIMTHVAEMKNPGEMHGLDVGCSYGLKTLILKCLGVNHVDGCDVAEELIAGANTWLKQVDLDGFSFTHNPSSSLPFGDSLYDWVTTMGLYANLNEQATAGLFADCYRILKPGGILMFHDSSNPLFPAIRDQIYAYHHQVEIGDGNRDNPNGSAHLERLDYINKQFGEKLTNDQKNNIALNTCYFGRDEIDEAVEHVLASGFLPSSRFQPNQFDQVPVRLANKTPCRRPTNPYTLKQELETAGFSKIIFRTTSPGRHIAEEDYEDYFSANAAILVTAFK